LQEREDSGARSRTLKAHQCVSTGQRRERECMLLLGENIHKFKGGYCPDPSWSRHLYRAWMYYVTPSHEMDFNTDTGRVTLVSIQANLHVNTQLNTRQWNKCM